MSIQCDNCQELGTWRLTYLTPRGKKIMEMIKCDTHADQEQTLVATGLSMATVEFTHIRPDLPSA